MPRYYFHIFDGRSVIDTNGIELFDAARAREEAVRLAGTILREEAATVALCRVWEMNVTDGEGRALFEVAFTVREQQVPPSPP